MSSADHVIIAGAGISGLTAALALARNGFQVSLFEQAEKLEEIGAGIQLSPNATRILMTLGLDERLKGTITKPDSVRVMDAPSGKEIVQLPLNVAEARYGAPFWVLHRADLQSALADAVAAMPNITLRLGRAVDGFTIHSRGVSVFSQSEKQIIEERGASLIGADGIRSKIAKHLHENHDLTFIHRTAWRALIPAKQVDQECRAPHIHLWLGPQAHLVHYPVKGCALINFVAILPDNDGSGSSWPAYGTRDEILRHFRRGTWAERARSLVAVPEQWQKWGLYRSKGFRGGEGAVTLVGDAAHPMQPFLAQGAGLAIEDAVVLTQCLHSCPDDPTHALRQYEKARWPRAERAQHMSAQQGRIYNMSGPAAFSRNLIMRALGGERLLGRYDWLYRWQPPQFVGT